MQVNLAGTAMLTNLQGLRALAAMLVVLYHALTADVFGPGRFGVDIFFVVSGFIMVYATKQEFSGIRFLAKRLIRVVPLYWSLTLLVFTVAVFAPHLLKATEVDFNQLIKSLLFIPFMKSNGMVHPTLFLGWTLNYEMFFYLLFSVFVVFPNRLHTVICVSTVIGFLVILGHVLDGSVVFEFYTNAIMLEFVAGMCLGLISDRLRLAPIPALALAVAGLAGAAMLDGLVTHENRGLLFSPFALLVVAAAVGVEKSGMRLKNPLLLLIGAASYSLYLVHPYVIGLVEKLGIPASWLVAIILSVCAAIVILYAIERPANRILRGIMGSRRLMSLQVDSGSRPAETADRRTNT
ncbi:MAG: acyltransferase [Sphingomonadaceae bacterium]|nr:acyltransferase [Sphingomonadaceae bacterium]